jgi:acetolactate synthase-1/2/3 large subunit
MDDRTALAPTSAEAFLSRLGERGIEFVFANAGTDFASIVEALARNTEGTRQYPRFITVPHENVAMAMAHGYCRLSGKPAGVMVHVTVGTANAVCGLMNAARDNIPVLLAAGRTPLSDTGHRASRDRSIHWGQEMFDQGGMVREFVKWDYELRQGQSAGALVDRALDIAMSEPRGPVYLTLPREVLANQAYAARRDRVRPLGSAPAVPDRAAIEEAARLLASAEFPLILATAAGRTPEAFETLSTLARDYAIPVAQNEARDLNIATDHPMHLGFDSMPYLAKADVIVTLDCPIPWSPRAGTPNPKVKIVHIAADPLAARYPYMEFEADVLIAGETGAALAMLNECLAEAARSKSEQVARRRSIAAELREANQRATEQLLARVRDQSPIHPAAVAACLNEQKQPDAIIVNELGLPVNQLAMTTPLSYVGTGPAGGLGFGLGAALGAKLAAPAREVISLVGDGSYFFGNPLSAHFVGRAESLPTLTIISNNRSWHAVRRSTLDVYPDSFAAKANVMPLVDLAPSPDFEKVVESCGGHGERVDEPRTLPEAMKRAFAAVRSGTPAVLNIQTQAAR